MPNYRRAYVPGGTYFFTVKTENNAPLFIEKKYAALLGDCFREAKSQWTFETIAIALLPDHLHAIWTLPRGDADYSLRWAWIKKEFTKAYLECGGEEQAISHSRKANRRRGVWQRRFWEHVIEDEQDFENHFDYIHWNPVKHGYVDCPRYWPHSSFHRWVARGVYEPNWGCGSAPVTVSRIKDGGE